VGILDNTYRLLHEIKKRPGLYLGRPSLELLRTFLCGYSYHGIEPYGIGQPDCLTGFTEYIQKKYRLCTDHDWASVIRFFSSSDEEAFETFYQKLDEYLQNPIEMKEVKKLLWADAEKLVEAHGNALLIYTRGDKGDYYFNRTVDTKESIVPMYHKVEVKGDWMFVYRIDETENQSELIEKLDISLE